MTDLELDIKTLIIESLDLEDIEPSDIDTDAPLFNEGLGLDSIDALELGMAIQSRYGVSIDAEDENTSEYFRSVKNLAAFVSSHDKLTAN
jgi:acyl carrier protein